MEETCAPYNTEIWCSQGIHSFQILAQTANSGATALLKHKAWWPKKISQKERSSNRSAKSGDKDFVLILKLLECNRMHDISPEWKKQKPEAVFCCSRQRAAGIASLCDHTFLAFAFIHPLQFTPRIIQFQKYPPPAKHSAVLSSSHTWRSPFLHLTSLSPTPLLPSCFPLITSSACSLSPLCLPPSPSLNVCCCCLFFFAATTDLFSCSCSALVLNAFLNSPSSSSTTCFKNTSTD